MKQNWQKAEEEWGKHIPNSIGQPGSGNKPGAPGDRRHTSRLTIETSGKFLFEIKSAEGESLSIKEKWLNKITMEALQLGRKPALGMTIGKQMWLAFPVEDLVIEHKEN